MLINVIDQLYEAQAEVIGHIKNATVATKPDLLLRWAQELAELTTQIDLRMKAGATMPGAWSRLRAGR